MLSVPRLAMYQQYRRYSGAKIYPGTGMGIMKMYMPILGSKRIDAKRTAETAPEAPKAL